MDEAIEVTPHLFAARNRQTGSRIYLDDRFFDSEDIDFLYDNPTFGVKVAVAKKSIYNKREVEINGTTKVWNVCVGIVLEVGRLQSDLKRQPNPDLHRRPVDEMVEDFYRLIVGCFTSHYQHYYARHPHDAFHIYEAETRAFNLLSREIGLDDVVASRAKLVA